MQKRILVVKLGALGDLFIAFRRLAHVREIHPEAHITLLTRTPYVEMMQKCPWFDEVIEDKNPHSFNIFGIAAINRRIASGGFEMIYNFQSGSRIKRYLFMVGGKHYHHKPAPEDAKIDNSWLSADITDLSLPDEYVVLVIGCAPHRTEKRWSAENYGKLCVELQKRGLKPVLVGSEPEIKIANEILAICPDAISLVCRTNLLELCSVISGASLAIGNDTGAIHIANHLKLPTIALASRFSEFLTKREESHFSALYATNINDIKLDEVLSHTFLSSRFNS